MRQRVCVSMIPCARACTCVHAYARMCEYDVCLDRALAQFPLCWCQLNGVQSSYSYDSESKAFRHSPHGCVCFFRHGFLVTCAASGFRGVMDGYIL